MFRKSQLFDQTTLVWVKKLNRISCPSCREKQVRCLKKETVIRLIRYYKTTTPPTIEYTAVLGIAMSVIASIIALMTITIAFEFVNSIEKIAFQTFTVLLGISGVLCFIYYYSRKTQNQKERLLLCLLEDHFSNLGRGEK